MSVKIMVCAESHCIKQKRFKANQRRMGSKLQISKNNSEFKEQDRMQGELECQKEK